jgi:hypothetical protein
MNGNIKSWMQNELGNVDIQLIGNHENFPKHRGWGKIDFKFVVNNVNVPSCCIFSLIQIE